MVDRELAHEAVAERAIANWTAGDRDTAEPRVQAAAALQRECWREPVHCDLNVERDQLSAGIARGLQRIRVDEQRFAIPARA